MAAASKTIWQPQPGFQTEMIQTSADEVLAGGARGPGKTMGGIFWLLKGNPKMPEGHPIHATALNYPRYTALVVRRQWQDLRDWIDQAEEVYKSTEGFSIKGNPPVLTWKTGAKIYTDHMNDENAFNKYRGWNLHRILFEELTEIPYLKWYLRLLGSLRSKKLEDGSPIIKPQILSTTNPDGPGRMWVYKRFVNVYGKTGIFPPKTLMLDPITGLTRIFIPALLDENKFLGPEYERMLLAQRAESEATYLAWRWGRWDVFSGQFFDTLRFDGPMPGEEREKFPWANHGYSPIEVQLAEWWPMAIGVDWGYNHESAAYWGRWGQNDKRLYVEDELVVRRTGSRELGQMIAQRTLPHLIGLGEAAHIPLFLSHDAYSKEDNTRTRAELFCEGLEDVLGPNSAHLAEFTDSEKKMQPADAFASMENRYVSLSNGACITVHRARQDRAAMASYIREMLSWRVLDKKEPDLEYARTLLSADNGLILYEQYLEKFRKQDRDPVPKLKINTKKCPRLRDCLTSLIYDPDNTEVPLKVNSTPEGEPGDDPYDGFCHLVMGAKLVANRKPRSVFVGERVNKFREQFGADMDPAVLGQIYEKAHADWTGQTPPAWENFDSVRLQ